MSAHDEGESRQNKNTTLLFGAPFINILVDFIQTKFCSYVLMI